MHHGHHSYLCLIQLLQLLQHNPSVNANDLVVFHLYNNRNCFSPDEFRKWVLRFVRVGANPFSKDLDDVSKVMIQSIVARYDK